MHVIEDGNDLSAVEPCHDTIEPSKLLDHIQQLAELQEILEHVKVPRVLIYALQVADEGMMHLGHVLDLIVDVLLLLRFKHFGLGDNLQSEHLLILIRLEGVQPLEFVIWRGLSIFAELAFFRIRLFFLHLEVGVA